MSNSLVTPKGFALKFVEVAKKSKILAGRTNEQWTQWFGSAMQEIAKDAGYYCQNLQTGDRNAGEWMCIDHVFVSENSYGSFPLIAVEHENRGLSDTAAQSGLLPGGTQPGSCIEWATWKVLAMTSKLHVLVAYPPEGQKTNCVKALALIVQGYLREYERMPNVLFLLGWWNQGGNGFDASSYVPYEAVLGQHRLVSLCEIVMP